MGENHLRVAARTRSGKAGFFLHRDGRAAAPPLEIAG